MITMLDLIREAALIIFETFVAFIFMFLLITTTDIVGKDINKKWEWTIYLTVLISMAIFILNIGIHWASFIVPLIIGWIVYKFFN